MLYDRHIEQENNDSIDETISPLSTVKSHFTDKYVVTFKVGTLSHLNCYLHSSRPVLWQRSAQPSLTESYTLHSHLTVQKHTTSLAHHYQSKSFTSNPIHLNASFDHVNKSHLIIEPHTGGKHRPSTSIELDHSYSFSSHHINQALSTVVEPEPPSPSTSPLPPLSLLPSTAVVSTPQQIMLISTPPTPPSSSLPINQNEIDISQQQQQQPFFSKPSSTSYVLSQSTPYFPTHVTPSTPPPSSPSSCGLVQFVQLHRILPTTKTHNLASSTPVTTFDS